MKVDGRPYRYELSLHAIISRYNLVCAVELLVSAIINCFVLNNDIKFNFYLFIGSSI